MIGTGLTRRTIIIAHRLPGTTGITRDLRRVR